MSKTIEPEFKYWTLETIRSLCEEDDVRNSVLIYMLSTNFPEFLNNFYFGETLDILDPSQMPGGSLEAYIQHILQISHTTGKNYLFTLDNGADGESQTHFQSFIYLAVEKTFIAIDPAKVNKLSKIQGRDAIYDGKAVKGLRKAIQKNFKHLGINLHELEITNAAQTRNEDVFCQTWSLYLQVNYMLNILHYYKTYNSIDINNVPLVNIPPGQLNRYRVIDSFYKQILHMPFLTNHNILPQQNGQISNYLNQEYLKVINLGKAGLWPSKKRITAKDHTKLQKLDPSALILNSDENLYVSSDGDELNDTAPSVRRSSRIVGMGGGKRKSKNKYTHLNPGSIVVLKNGTHAKIMENRQMRFIKKK